MRPTRRLVALLLALALFAAACSGNKPAGAKGVLATRTIAAGAVEVTITPRFDDQGATIALSLDTHAVELTTDLRTAAALTVHGATWPLTEWRGDGPGGHHRSGELRYQPGGPAQGTAQLTISGLPKPVEARWDLPAS